jgi:hypothetical protein
MRHPQEKWLNIPFPNGGEYMLTIATWGEEAIVVTTHAVYRVVPSLGGQGFMVCPITNR